MAEVEEQRNAAQPNADRLTEFRDYARGIQPTALTPGQARILANLLGHLYTDNLCKLALRALRDPLRIQRFTVAGDGQPAADVQEFVETAASLTGIPVLARRVHWAMLRDGDTAVGLAWHAPSKRVLIRREAWWNGTTGVWVAYDDDDQVEYAVKDWQVKSAKRRTVWYPSYIERWIDQGGGWEQYMLPEDNGQWPVPWVDAAGQPLNPPVVHFSNDQIPNDGRGDGAFDEPDSRYGMSELDGVLAIQDAVNDIHRDAQASARFAGFPMVVGTGIPPQVDISTGQEAGFAVEPGAFIRSGDPSARVEMLQPGSLAELERAIMLELRAFSRVTGVPIHHLTGADWPSGTALIMSMVDYFDKLQSIADSLAPRWGSVMHKATKLANTFGKAGLDEAVMISADFAPVVRYDSLTQAQIVAAVGPFVSEREKLRLLDYTVDEQDRILQERANDAAASPDAQRTLAETARTRAITAAETAMMSGQDSTAVGIMDRIAQAAGGITTGTAGGQ